MNNRQKLFLVVLVILGLLYFCSLGIGLRFNSSEQPRPSDYKPQSWIKWLGGLMAPFGPKLNLGPLRCDGQSVANPFTLNRATAACSIIIKPDPQEDYRKAALRIAPSAPIQVYLPAEKEPNCKTALPPGLKVIYQANGQESPDTGCWSTHDYKRESVQLVILKEGGTLTLQCEACTQREDLSVKLTFE